jgi:C4-dicarboxylate transporter DctM subunit
MSFRAAALGVPSGAPQAIDGMVLMPMPGALLRKLVPSVLMIVLVLGGLYAGYFTATEAGAVGARWRW